MIILDTHIFIWWVHGDRRLTDSQTTIIRANERQTIGVSAISVWEIAKLVEYGRLKLPCDLQDWFDTALSYPGIRLIELTPTIAIWSTRLPGKFHRDPADQIIVATAMTYDCPLVTSDEKILGYIHVDAIK
ncbi:MAG: type II toxin-antitoxin system VapC family toxin [Syntrophobacteraceae bacterium]|nr:type II toxin-antitoxin system VapC family toxin [Syntrophobacteraceae bacterium]